MIKVFKEQKGLTVIELLLVLSMLSIIIVGSLNLLSFGNRAHRLAESEAQVQSSARLISEHINQVTRFATAAHTVPRSSFQDADYRDPEWSYVGINQNGDVVIDLPGSPREVTIIAEKQDDISYELEFLRVYNEEGSLTDKIAGFSIKGFRNGVLVNTIFSQAEVLNALQVEHKGSTGNPAVALAFSTIEPGSPEFIQVTPDAHIAMVIDISGSMASDMSGGNSGKSRITILKETLFPMIDKLSNMGFDIYVTLVPFSTHANDPLTYKNVNKNNPVNAGYPNSGELADLKNSVEALTPGGWTNTGDGLRRAYYQLKNAESDYLANNPGKSHSDFTQHMMVLVDGATNRETRTVTSRVCTRWVFFWCLNWSAESVLTINSDSNITNANSVGNNYAGEVATHDNAYVNALGTLVQANKHDGEQIIKTFVIGFSALSSDHVNLDAIGNATNAKEFDHNGTTKRFVIATDASELDFAFGNFVEEVSTSLWSIYGPKLND